MGNKYYISCKVELECEPMNKKINSIKRISAVLLILSMLFGCVGCSSNSSDSQASGQNVEATDKNGSDSNIEETASAEDETESDDEVVSSENTQEAEEAAEDNVVPALRDAIKNNIDCRIGAAVTLDEINDEKVWNIITTHFETVTFGNELKPDALFGYSNSKCPGIETAEVDGNTIEVPVMDYTRAEKMLDKILDWNTDNPDRIIKVRGHVLVWHSQTPEWFFHEGYDKKNPYVNKDVMNLRLEWYIKTVLTHFTGEDSKYKGMFYGWDVVNEAVSDNGGKYRSENENPSESLSMDRHGSNSSWWAVYGSEEYIVNAFKYANKYAPEELELYYNDYNECNAVKRSGIVKLLETVKAAEGEPGTGTRITAMGMQGHYDMSDPNISLVQTSIEEYARVVTNVQITEMDLKASSDYDGTDETRDDEYEKQRKRYNTLLYAIKAANSETDVNVTGITFWGTVDKYSWLQNSSNVGGGNTSRTSQCPLLFDNDYEPKPCFWVFAQE